METLALAKTLSNLSISKGLDSSNGRIFDEITEDGVPAKTSSRSWPYAEAFKALTEIPESTSTEKHEGLISTILSRMLNLYIPPHLHGGWHDQLDEDDKPVRNNMPASSFYHIYFGLTSVDEFLRKN